MCEYYPGEPEFDNVFALLEEWTVQNNITTTQCNGQEEVMADEFEVWCKQNHPDVAELVADDVSIYHAVLSFWCMTQTDDEQE